MRVNLVVAVARNGVIGRKGQLPWRLPSDLRQFRRITLGHPVVMGRVTHESIGRALPGRRNVVITRDSSRVAVGCEAVASLEAALKLLMDEPEVMIIGGRGLYAEALPMADRLYLTEVLADVEGDVSFPPFEPADFKELECVGHPAEEGDEFACRFRVLERVND
jgi:dihydrofolate reductase